MTLTPAQFVQRKGRITASAVPAILGVSPWGTPLSAYAEIMQIIPRSTIDSLMHIRIGNLIEPVCAQLWEEETGRKLAPSPGTTFHPKFPWLGATRDRQIVAGNGFGTGPLEAKSVSPFKGQYWKDDSAPLHVEMQLQIQMFVPVGETVDGYGEIAALVGGYSFQMRKRWYDDAFVKAMVARCQEFYDLYIRTETPPPATDSDADADTLKAMYGQDDGRSLAVDEPLKATVVRLYECRQAIKRLKREEVGIANFIRERLTTATCWTFGDKPILTSRTGKNGQRPLLVKEKNLGLQLPETTEEDEDG